jgi:hypothetical protein
MCGNARARMRLAVILLGTSLSFTACSRAEDPSPAGAKPAEGKPAAAATPDARRPGASAAPIAFATDSTVTSVQGTLAADSDAEFVIGEEKGTLLLLQVIAPSQDPKLTIHRADNGANLPDEHPDNVAHWIERLPDTVGYLIVVHKTGTATPFVLNLEKPRALFFDDRTRTAEVKLAAPAHAVVSFVVPPSASITADLIAAPKDAYLTIGGLDDGKTLLSAEANKRSFSGALEKPDDAILRVNMGATGGDVALRVQRTQ